MRKKKIRVAIDINEILRARWLQFDRFYQEEFGEEGLPKRDNHYVFDFFKEYTWKDTVEKFKELREPEDTPEFINPLDYQVDEKTGEAVADSALFKKEEKIHLSARDMYDRFMYEDYLFEIFGSANLMYRNLDLDLIKFYYKYKDKAEIILFSNENDRSIAPTLFFVSKLMPKIRKYVFVEKDDDIWNDADIVISTNPHYFKNKAPEKKKTIKIERPYNVDREYKYFDLRDTELINLFDKKEFNKLLKIK